MDGVIMCGRGGCVAIAVFAIDKEGVAGIINEVAVTAIKVVAAWVVHMLAEAIIVVYVTAGVICDIVVIPLTISVAAGIIWEAAAIAIIDVLMLPTIKSRGCEFQ